ncbi:MAG: hypothetical protein LC754_09195 [Acidobacteria bacterium]|nr:hypothetical protein [Acidobacteriota bacterium]
MKNSEPLTDKIYARPPHFTLRYRTGPRLLWSSEARHDYGALFLLGGNLRWQDARGETGELEAGGALLVAPGDTLSAASAGRAEFVTLSLAPLYVLDCAARARLMRADGFITFPAHAITFDERLARLARDVAEELLEESPGQEVVISAILEQTLVHLLRQHAGVPPTSGLDSSPRLLPLCVRPRCRRILPAARRRL